MINARIKEGDFRINLAVMPLYTVIIILTCNDLISGAVFCIR